MLIDLTKEIEIFSRKDCPFETDFDVVVEATVTRYTSLQEICSVNLGPIEFFNQIELTADSGKRSESVVFAQNWSLIYQKI